MGMYFLAVGNIFDPCFYYFRDNESVTNSFKATDLINNDTTGTHCVEGNDIQIHSKKDLSAKLTKDDIEICNNNISKNKFEGKNTQDNLVDCISELSIKEIKNNENVRV